MIVVIVIYHIFEQFSIECKTWPLFIFSKNISWLTLLFSYVGETTVKFTFLNENIPTHLRFRFGLISNSY